MLIAMTKRQRAAVGHVPVEFPQKHPSAIGNIGKLNFRSPGSPSALELLLTYPGMDKLLAT